MSLLTEAKPYLEDALIIEEYIKKNNKRFTQKISEEIEVLKKMCTRLEKYQKLSKTPHPTDAIKAIKKIMIDLYAIKTNSVSKDFSQKITNEERINEVKGYKWKFWTRDNYTPKINSYDRFLANINGLNINDMLILLFNILRIEVSSKYSNEEIKQLIQKHFGQKPKGDNVPYQAIILQDAKLHLPIEYCNDANNNTLFLHTDFAGNADIYRNLSSLDIEDIIKIPDKKIIKTALGL